MEDHVQDTCAADAHAAFKDARAAEYACRRTRKWRSQKSGPHNAPRCRAWEGLRPKQWRSRFESCCFREKQSELDAILVRELRVCRAQQLLEDTGFEPAFLPVPAAKHTDEKKAMGEGISLHSCHPPPTCNSSTAAPSGGCMSLVVCGGTGAFVQELTPSKIQALQALEESRCEASRSVLSCDGQSRCLEQRRRQAREFVVDTRKALIAEEQSLRQTLNDHVKEVKAIEASFRKECYDAVLGLEALEGRRVEDFNACADAAAHACREAEKVVEASSRTIQKCAGQLRSASSLVHLPCKAARKARRRLPAGHLEGLTSLPVFASWTFFRDNQEALRDSQDKRCKERQARIDSLVACHRELRGDWQRKRAKWNFESIEAAIREAEARRDRLDQRLQALRKSRSCPETELRLAGEERRSRYVTELSSRACCASESMCIECTPCMESVFESIRNIFLQENHALVRRHLLDGFSLEAPSNIKFHPAPVTSELKARFLATWSLGAGSQSHRLAPAFHGTATRNLKSIYARGLLIPGMGNEVRIANGAAHGRGIYAGKLNEGGTGLSVFFARNNPAGMLLCAVLDNAQAVSQDYKVGFRYVTAESKEVRHVGAAYVVFDPRFILPLFSIEVV
eukprot:TRINITY_DN12167_c0_g3_i1.p1 TRINITY_DN12167_c0_g3~~TRINITY_DN12167_c0_g3_i1.p1  ORF type:complete len:625 (-),score=105.13 TRINITY_DN12167_c0_g3_i1:263-2137(-)